MTDFAFLVVYHSLHVHVPNVRVIGKIVCEGPVVRREEGQSQSVGGQLMQDSLE